MNIDNNILLQLQNTFPSSTIPFSLDSEFPFLLLSFKTKPQKNRRETVRFKCPESDFHLLVHNAKSQIKSQISFGESLANNYHSLVFFGVKKVVNMFAGAITYNVLALGEVGDFIAEYFLPKRRYDKKR